MAGIRINDASLTPKTTFESAIDFKLLIDKVGESEARTLLVKLLGNSIVQGSVNGTDWHYNITSNDTLFRISTDGGTTFINVDLGLKNNLYLKNGVPYTSVNDVTSTIPVGLRSPYLTVNINGIEYWFTDSATLVEKFSSLTIPDGSVTLAKLANVASQTVFFRSDSGVGVPMAVPLATLMTAMNLSGTNTGDETKSTIESKLGLIAPSDHFVQNDELNDYVLAVAGYGLISDADLATLQNQATIVTITLPSASTVTGRIAAATSGVDYPSDWTLTPDGIDLIITHSLGKRIANVTVFSDNLNIERQLFGNAAYSGIYQDHTTGFNSLVIESLATIETNITIELIFSSSIVNTGTPTAVLATVETYTPSNITDTSFNTGGTVTNDGNSAVTDRGIVYSTVSNPTILDNKISSGEGVGFFFCDIIDLAPDTMYYYRSFATNSIGTAYGRSINFKTHTS